MQNLSNQFQSTLIFLCTFILESECRMRTKQKQDILCNQKIIPLKIHSYWLQSFTPDTTIQTLDDTEKPNGMIVNTAIRHDSAEMTPAVCDGIAQHNTDLWHTMIHLHRHSVPKCRYHTCHLMITFKRISKSSSSHQFLLWLFITSAIS